MSSNDSGALVFAPFRDQLLEVARASIRQGLLHGRALTPDPMEPGPLTRAGACFVTLHLERQLRGCIGTLEPHRPLLEDVAENAFAAAFRDPRFAPVTESEFVELRLHLSILHPPQPLECASEGELGELLRPGTDGLIIAADGRRATFLPAVWDALPDAAVFVHQLKLKAGLAADYWSDELRAWRYTTESIE